MSYQASILDPNDHWTKRPLLSVDIETTGVDPLVDRIVTFGAAVLAPDGQVATSMSILVKPDDSFIIPPEASEIHGISHDFAMANGIEASTAVGYILASLTSAMEEDWAIVVYNAPYDMTIISRELYRWRKEREPEPDPLNAPNYLDPLVIDKQLDKYRKGSRKLIDTAAHYGVPLDEDEAHGALADAIAAGRLAQALARRYPEPLMRYTVGAIDLVQRDWYREQRTGFEHYLRVEKGEDVTLSKDWPVQDPAEWSEVRGEA